VPFEGSTGAAAAFAGVSAALAARSVAWQRMLCAAMTLTLSRQRSARRARWHAGTVALRVTRQKSSSMALRRHRRGGGVSGARRGCLPVDLSTLP